MEMRPFFAHFSHFSALFFALLLFIHCAHAATYKGNYALSFDGVDDLVTIQPSFLDAELDDFWTLEAWIKPTASQQYWQLNLLGFAGRHPNLEFCGPGNSQCSPGTPLTQLREADGTYFTITGTPDLTADVWHHVCGTWDNTTLSLYVDGVLDASINPYANKFVEGKNCVDFDCDVGIQIGGFKLRNRDGSMFSGQYFRGLMDEVRVWKVGRSQAEIVSSMKTTLTGAEPGLQYYWRFDEGFGHVIASHAEDAYGLLGGGLVTSQPKFIVSDAPIAAGSSDVGNMDEIIIEKNSPMAIAAGAMIAVFFLLGGVSIGTIVGWKVHEKRYSLKWAWESEGLLSNYHPNVVSNDAAGPQPVPADQKGKRPVREEGSSGAPGAHEDEDDGGDSDRILA